MNINIKENMDDLINCAIVKMKIDLIQIVNKMPYDEIDGKKYVCVDDVIQQIVSFDPNKEG